ncbi:hypothetical protein GHT06_020786 [Daphnia sinensis]|uniref:Uncharacterized protein n=1 Tax=Daphnia sinensis TaxID=1820382 RepID=A0AAD5PN68_9CRUS|nr:hypothetical protein GHT06_020786 [Daphnia sinensis]
MSQWKDIARIYYEFDNFSSHFLNVTGYQWYKNNVPTGGTIYLVFVVCVETFMSCCT